MSSVTFGYRREISIQKQPKKVFSNSGKAFLIEEGQQIRIVLKPGHILEGPVYTIVDNYFTVGINEESLSAICVFNNEFINIEIL